MNKSLTLNKNNFPLLQVHSKKSLLTVAVIASLGTSSNAYAGDTVGCSEGNGNCTSGPLILGAPDQTDIKGGFLLTDVDNKGHTISLNDNTVTLNYTEVDPSNPTQPTISAVYGASTMALDVKVENNNVYIKNGVVTSMAIGGFSYKGEAIGNTVNMEEGSVGLYVRGGYSILSNATSNAVTVSGGRVDKGVIGGYGSSGDATGNIATISGGMVDTFVIGGYSDNGDATDNTVTISGGTIKGDVAGSRSVNGGKATGNTVNLAKGSPIIFNADTELYGGQGRSDFTTDNTLNIHRKGIKVSNVKNFEHYNFYLDNDVLDSSTMLKLTSTNATDLSASMYGIGVKTGTTTLPQGYTVTLIESTTTLTLSSLNPANDITKMTDIVSGYEFRLSVKDGKKLVAELPYTVTIENSDLSKGIVSNESEVAYLNETITFDATPNPGYVASTSSTCGTTGSWNDNTYTSSEITDKCIITVNWDEINHTIFSDSFE